MLLNLKRYELKLDEIIIAFILMKTKNYISLKFYILFMDGLKYLKELHRYKTMFIGMIQHPYE